MKILPIPAFHDNYIWTLIDETNRTAICIDPGEAEPVLSFLHKENLLLQSILLTHHHYDHIGGTPELLATYPKIIVYSPNDSRISHATHVLKDNDLLSLDAYRFQIMSIPGHTATHISFYESHYGWLFCGDTLFSAGCGRVFDSTIEELHDSLQRLKHLPEETKVYCAHEYTQQNLRFAATVEPENLVIRHYLQQLFANKKQCTLPSTIRLEKQINPFFRTQTQAVQTYATLRGNLKKDSLSVFKQIRADKDVFN